MEVSIFGAFGLQMLVRAPKFGFLGILTPQVGIMGAREGIITGKSGGIILRCASHC